MASRTWGSEEASTDMIDIHTHIGMRIRVGEEPYSADELLQVMDRAGIEKAVLLPLESPEGHWHYVLTDQVVEAAEAHPDRFIPFGAADPRTGKVEAQVRHLREIGCVGFGEHKCGLAFDDPRSVTIYQVCGELGFPVLFHGGGRGGINGDDPHLPRVEKCLQECSNTVFIGHAAFWFSISSDYAGEGGYPTGRIKPVGATDRLLGTYPNLYGDLSARSGWDAIARDPEFGNDFIRRHSERLLFGTDLLYRQQEVPILRMREVLDVPDDLYAAITRGNAERLLGLTP